MALEKQVWIDQIKENFYPDSSFLKLTTDFSSLVNNAFINMAEAGIDPAVLLNNTTYPVPIKTRDDKAIQIPLDEFSTENTVVRDAEKKQLSYDKVESVVYSHRQTLRSACAQKAAHAIAPAKDSDFTPVLLTTGTVKNGVKTLTPADILDLKARFDDMNTPLEDRVLVLSPSHVRDLILFNLESFKDIADLANGQPRKFAGFNIFPFTKMPIYDSTGTKKAYGSAAVEGDQAASFAFCKTEVMRADGEYTMFERLNDPEQRGDIIGFSKRFISMPIRGKGIGAIISANA